MKYQIYIAQSTNFAARFKYLLIFRIFLIFLIFESTYAQEQWRVFTTQNSGLPGNGIACIAVDSNNVKWIGTGNGLVKYDGVNWTVYDTTNSGLLDNNAYRIAISQNNIVWIGTRKGLARFDGINWTVFDTSNSELPYDWVFCVDVDKNNSIWAGTPFGLAKFDGFNWTIYKTTNSGLPSDFIYTLDVNDSIKWIGTYSYGLVKYVDTSWTVYNINNSGISSNSMRSICSKNDGHVWIATLFGGVGDYNYILNNWTVYNTNNSGLPENNLNAIHENENSIWIGTVSAGLARYKLNIWTIFTNTNSPLPGNSVYWITEDRYGNIWIGTGDGLAVYNDSGIIGIKNNQEKIPDKFKLFQNYPNPFNSSTIIKFYISETGSYTLIITDIQGKEVKRLLNKTLNKGQYSITFLPDNLASGIYFYTLKHEAETIGVTRKMLLIK